MRYPPEALLDACIAELKQGVDLEEILAGRPESADELRPLLAAAAWAYLEVPPARRSHIQKRDLMTLVEQRRRLVESTDGYVNEVKAGVPVDELVRRAPQELVAVVMAAWRMETTECPEPSTATVAEQKGQLMALAAERRRALHPAREPMGEALRRHLGEVAAGIQLRPSTVRRARGSLAALAATILLVAGVAGVNTAAASSLPGEPFYGVKRLGENAQLMLASDGVNRATLNLEFAQRRQAEMQRLTAAGRTVPADLTDEWLRRQSAAWRDISQLPADQRQLLAGLLLASLQDNPALAGTNDAVALTASVKDALGVEGPAAPTSDPVLDTGPMAVQRPLPAEDARAPEAAQAHQPTQPEPQVGAPASPAPEPVAAEPAPPPAAAPAVEPSRSGHEKKADEPTTPVDPAAGPPTASAPPAFGMPGIDPTVPDPQQPGGDTPAP